MSAEAVAALTEAGFPEPHVKAVDAVATIAPALVARFGIEPAIAFAAAAQSYCAMIGLKEPADITSTRATSAPTRDNDAEAAAQILASIR